MHEQRMLVFIDALLDTRIATLSRMAPEAAAELFSREQSMYWKRTDDNFEVMTNGAVTQAEYLEAYAKRDVATLKHSSMTSLVLLLSGMVASLDTLRNNTPTVTSVRVDLNMWPYRLTPEQTELYATCVSAYAGMETPINPVFVPIESVTPDNMRNQWEAVILYDLDEWVTHHLGSLTVNKIPRQTLIAPARSANEDVSPERLQKLGITEHPFAVVEREFAPMIGLDLLDGKYFSAIPPKWQ